MQIIECMQVLLLALFQQDGPSHATALICSGNEAWNPEAYSKVPSKFVNQSGWYRLASKPLYGGLFTNACGVDKGQQHNWLVY